MALPSPLDDCYYLGTTRHSDISPPLLPSQCPFQTPWHSPHGACAFCANPSPAFVRDSILAPRQNDLQSSQDTGHTVLPSRSYPSPPLTGSTLRSTVPLPDIFGESSTDYYMLRKFAKAGHQSMPLETAANIREPLSPPPTHLLGTHDLPDVGSSRGSLSSSLIPDSEVCLHTSSEDSSQLTATIRSLYRTDRADLTIDCDVPSQSSSFGRGPSTGWSCEGNPSGLDTVPEDSVLDSHSTPSRADSGFEEFFPQRDYKGERLPDLEEEPDAPFSKIEPSSYWTPQSPVSIHSLLDDRSASNPAVGRGDYRQDSLLPVSPMQCEQNDRTPSWSSVCCSSWSDRDSDFSPPISPRPSISLNLPDLDDFPSHEHPECASCGADDEHIMVLGSSISPSRPRSWFGLQDRQVEDARYPDTHRIDTMTVDSEPPPSSPRPPPIHLSLSDPDSDISFSDTIIPGDDDLWGSPLASPSSWQTSSMPFQSTLQDNMCVTPLPRSPHHTLASLSDFDMSESLEEPDSPSSPNIDLPLLPGEYNQPPADEHTAALSVPGPSGDHEGLGLFLQPVSVDPPLARSPSPDDDDLQFLDVQLDPTSSKLEVDEFLQLRAVRRRALSAERAARLAETEFGELVSNAAHALLPPATASQPSEALDPETKRIRKRELHLAMDMRAEARHARKFEKQRSKEIGALMDLKMERGIAPGPGAMRSMGQLVANMVLRRRDTFRPLANRNTGALVQPHTRSPLVHCFYSEDLLAGWADLDDDADADADAGIDADVNVDVDAGPFWGAYADMDVDLDVDADMNFSAEMWVDTNGDVDEDMGQ
ncbi:uncharacterized protein FIBRA_02170 [Fibroporia radiculosa]|uniref:Uncharacterized protein n=1 Tax=Fibroporia radiculosa TaxID=599839 RepID=J4G1E1_9APHY|nr:uncharacterized protein FIBRA_02170 [Fibroporia radiculosa]CCM00143.1 predicted protein [Fibroporia radiculosa]